MRERRHHQGEGSDALRTTCDHARPRGLAARFVLAAGAALGVALSVGGGAGCGDEDRAVNWEGTFDPNPGESRPPGGFGGTGTGAGGERTRFDPADPLAEGCPPRNVVGVRYSDVSPAECVTAVIPCDPGWLRFDASCGCGCATTAVLCPPAGDPRVSYLARAPATCPGAPSCLPGEVAFNDACGCGCLRATSSCRFDAFFGVERADVGREALCESLVICLDTDAQDVAVSGLAPQIAETICSPGAHPSCPAGTVSSCVGFVGVLPNTWASSFCAATATSGVRAIGCGATF